jgi:hypothetical protein
MTRYTPFEEGVYNALGAGVASGMDPMYAWQVYSQLVSGAQQRVADRRATVTSEAAGLEDLLMQLAQSGATEESLSGILGSQDLGQGPFATKAEGGLEDLLAGLDWDPNTGLSGLVPADVRAQLSAGPVSAFNSEARLALMPQLQQAAQTDPSTENFWRAYNQFSSAMPEVNPNELLDFAVTQWVSAGGETPNAAVRRVQGAGMGVPVGTTLGGPQPMSSPEPPVYSFGPAPPAEETFASLYDALAGRQTYLSNPG